MCSLPMWLAKSSVSRFGSAVGVATQIGQICNYNSILVSSLFMLFSREKTFSGRQSRKISKIPNKISLAALLFVLQLYASLPALKTFHRETASTTTHYLATSAVFGCTSWKTYHFITNISVISAGVLVEFRLAEAQSTAMWARERHGAQLVWRHRLAQMRKIWQLVIGCTSVSISK